MYLVEFPKLGLELTVNPIAFSIGGFSVRWYGIILALGFLLGLLYAIRSSRVMNIDADKLFDTIIVGALVAVIFSRLYYVVFYNGNKFIDNPLEIFNFRDGGLGFYGALIGGLVGGALMCRHKKLKMPAVFDLAALGFLIGQSIGRWANFINQEAFGATTNLPWGMQSENTRLVIQGSVHPCFLYESLWCALGFLFLHIFTRKFRRYDGQTFLLYIVWYGVGRFFIEGIRTDSLFIPYIGLRVSQVVGISSALVAIILLLIFRHKTSLTGCGSKKVMEANAIVITPKGKDKKVDGESHDLEKSNFTDCGETDSDNKDAEDNDEVEE